ncbi:hypothetical protein GN958_ATG06136 [Phytophthora infestans]|uniref:Transmembrane protein n=1 Tax=Phytophthora infestans TaxID=4787 RepID=A0A8S9UZS2_PHYIN|nr:hypothetical protein GN958_ATG06136 [Phytophthora infestans]
MESVVIAVPVFKLVVVFEPVTLVSDAFSSPFCLWSAVMFTTGSAHDTWRSRSLHNCIGISFVIIGFGGVEVFVSTVRPAPAQSSHEGSRAAISCSSASRASRSRAAARVLGRCG